MGDDYCTSDQMTLNRCADVNHSEMTRTCEETVTLNRIIPIYSLTHNVQDADTDANVPPNTENSRCLYDTHLDENVLPSNQQYGTFSSGEIQQSSSMDFGCPPAEKTNFFVIISLLCLLCILVYIVNL